MNRLFLILGTAAVVIVAIAFFGSINREQPNGTVEQEGDSRNGDEQLLPSARTYSSDRLGIRFTYNSRPSENFEVTATERDNKIFLHGTMEAPEQGKLIEVFEKARELSLPDAINQRFLAGHDSGVCFVQEVPKSAADDRPASYSFAEISYPPPTDPQAPFFQNASRCPQPYAKTNAVQYFMMNADAPDKFVFLQLGQDSITDDGTVQPQEVRRDWSASVRIH